MAPQRQVWTPVGWKGHLFRYDVFYNGSIVCQPAVALPPPDSVEVIKPYLRKYIGQDFQVTPLMPQGGKAPVLPSEPYYMHRHDFGVGIQGWEPDSETPVLWTDFRRQEGLVLRQDLFAHLRGGKVVDTADEPLYAWIRYRMVHVDQDSPDTFEFTLRLSRAMLKHFVAPPEQQEAFLTMQVTPDAAPLPGALDVSWSWGGNPAHAAIVDKASGNVRLIVGVPANAGINLAQTEGHPGVYDLSITLPVKADNTVDVLLPYLFQSQEEAGREWQLGRDGAYAETESFWSEKATTAAQIQTPEPSVDQYFRRSVQLAEVIAEKSPDTKLYTFLTGSYGYDLLWSTPTSMISHMFLDQLGQHEIVARHLEPYRAVQGTRKPPGDAYEQVGKEGYFATPVSLQSYDWLADHGAILEAVSRHILLTGDRDFVERWLPAIIAGMDFIKRATAVTDHDGVAGLMPPARSNDTQIEQQTIWIQAWSYKGLRTGADVLLRENHPRAQEFAQLADAFKETFAKALREAAKQAPTWTDSDGVKHPILPAKFSGPDSSWPYLEAFDTGALTAVWAGLMPASDPLMTSFLEYFRVGPNTLLFDPWHHTALDRVVLDHEQSSAEPCYSWNLFHNWQTGDRHRFLEAMYGLMAGACSPDTFIAGEHRHGMYGTLFVQPIVTWAAKHAVIDDSLVADELHLFRLCPAAWIQPGKPLHMKRLATQYGPVTVQLTVSDDQTRIEITASADWRHKPERIYLHPPTDDGATIVVNGRQVSSSEPTEITF